MTNENISAQKPDIASVEFAQVGEQRLLLDIYHAKQDQTKQPTKSPLIVWVHGGAWRAGSRTQVPVTELTQHGFAIASVDYRLSPVAPFPAQAHDIKAAIRFLRANSAKYGFDPDRIVIAGASAGAHLAALVGVTNGHEELEGAVGNHKESSSAVQAIVSYYGASNLETILSQSTPHGLSVRVPALELLLGGQPDKQPRLAKLASPVTHVDAKDPPLLLLHGDQDPQMPINQSHELQGVYEQLNRPVKFQVIHGSAHGGPGFYTSSVTNQVAEFLSTHLSRK